MISQAWNMRLQADSNSSGDLLDDDGNISSAINEQLTWWWLSEGGLCSRAMDPLRQTDGGARVLLWELALRQSMSTYDTFHRINSIATINTVNKRTKDAEPEDESKPANVRFFTWQISWNNCERPQKNPGRLHV